MTIALLLLPYLVYDKVVKELGFNDRLSLAVLSKRARWIVKRNFGRQTFKLHITHNELYFMNQGTENEFTVNLSTIPYGNLENYDLWKHVLIPQKDHGMSPKEALKENLDWDVFTTRLTQFIIETFPKLKIRMVLQHKGRGLIHTSAAVIRESNLPIDHMSAICRNEKDTFHILRNCVTVKTLRIDGVLIDRTAILPALQCDEVTFEGTVRWAEQVVKGFMACRKFRYSIGVENFNFDGMMLILDAWKDNARLEYMELSCHSGVYQSLTKKIQGEPKKFKLWNRPHDCYLICQLNGKEAVIYMEDVLFASNSKKEVVALRTDFELVD